MVTDEIGIEELHAKRVSLRRTIRVLAALSFVMTSALGFFAFWLAQGLTSSELSGLLLGSALMAAITLPVLLAAIHVGGAWIESVHDMADQRELRLEDERRQRDFQSQVVDALEMAEREDSVLRVVERTLATVVPGRMAELLLADNSQAHLSQSAVAGPTDVQGCEVSTPNECPAARRARVHRFEDSAAVNACPMLAERPGRCGAVCVPVSVMGRTVGVIHTVHQLDDAVDSRTVRALETVADQAGARLGMVRVMAETQLQAETDGLTGLMNRRAFENRFRQLRNRSPHGFGVIALADLDNFKTINDTYGHDTGDRALRVFSQTLRSAVRAGDLVARHGGEEFAVVFPDCVLDAAYDILERLRVQLQTAVREAGLPSFTASFGLTPLFLSEDLDLLFARADAALFEAKRGGRDRVVTFTASDLHGSAEAAISTWETGGPGSYAAGRADKELAQDGSQS